MLDFVGMAFLQAGLLDASPHQHGGLAAVEALLASQAGAIGAAGAPLHTAWQAWLLWRGCSPCMAAPLRDPPARSGCAHSPAEWRGCVPEREQQRALLSKGVLTFDGDRLRFASNLAATYAAEQLQHNLPAAVVDQHPQLRRRSPWRG